MPYRKKRATSAQRAQAIEGEAGESAEGQMRPKTIVYFERISFGTLLLGVLQSYLDWDRIIARLLARVATMEPDVATVDRNLLTAIYLAIEIFAFVLIGTLILLVSRRRSKIAMGVLIAWFVLGLSGFLVSLVQSMGGLLGSDIVPVIGTVLQFIGQVVAVGLLFTPSARRWMSREDEKLRHVFH